MKNLVFIWGHLIIVVFFYIKFVVRQRNLAHDKDSLLCAYGPECTTKPIFPRQPISPAGPFLPRQPIITFQLFKPQP
jgi:hypothetical protein